MSKKMLPKMDTTEFMNPGPYSPVLEVDASKMVVITGQVAVDKDGKTVGDDIKTQTRQVLENCQRQLGHAGCGLQDVFKVTIFMHDLAQWADMNAVYVEMLPDPKPTRSAVQVGLPAGYLVEMEMWAVK